MTLSYAEVDLARLVLLTAAHFEGLAAERHVRFTVETPDHLLAEVDPEKLQRVFLNLLCNAFKFAAPGGTVRCAVGATGGRATIDVADDGPGVLPEMRELIFERFRQGDSGPARRFGGTGLGLSLAREFAELHGGTITVGTAPGGGALFTAELPLRAPAGVALTTAPAEGSLSSGELVRQAVEELGVRIEAPPTAPDTGQPLVLIVEDDVDMSRFIVEVLERDYRVATAFDGREGVEKALALRPDLILCDVMMPRLSGDTLVGEIRRSHALDDVPTILVTAKPDDGLRAPLLRGGAQDYITKPFSADELRARVGNLVAVKRAREVLQRELASQLQDLEALAMEATRRKRELEDALVSVQVARAHTERALKAKSIFVSLLSHELRTPLTALHTYLYVLARQSNALLPQHQKIVRNMTNASRQLRDLVESLLEQARIESGHLATRVEPVDLAALATAAVNEEQGRSEEKGLAVHLSAATDLPPLMSDPRLVRLILANLVSNAIKFTERGAVEVSVAYEDGAHRLVVRDSGPGIAIDLQATVFEPFEQLEPIRHKHTPGVGLGLALVKEMVAALGGCVDLKSEVGVGTTFTVVLAPSAPQAARASV